MERHPVVAVLLAITAFVVIVPVMLQMAREGLRLRQVWGYLLFGAGCLLVAVAYGLYDDRRQGYLALVGFAASVIGMLVQHRRRE
ncbi:MAG TPA: hypothetical protein VK939_12230 [Longimicrobiales bacterium]|nr:hypothetical protein [Longimicrobiales bacterium]